MTETAVCAKCQSDKIVPKARIMDRGHYSGDAGDLALVLYENLDGLIFKGSHNSSLFARFCGECGYTELFLENPRDLYAVYVGRRDAEA